MDVTRGYLVKRNTGLLSVSCVFPMLTRVTEPR